jgi:hypothetical protein
VVDTVVHGVVHNPASNVVEVTTVRNAREISLEALENV